MSVETRPPNPQERSARRNGKRRRLSRGQRWVLGILLTAVIVVGGAVVGLYLADFRMGDAGTLANLAPGDGTYLLVGTDSRENLPDDLEGKFGDFGGSRADVIILMQVVDGNRQMISIPRDLKVDIPGSGTNKINAAYAFGGPDLLVETVTAEFGIPINHYIEVSFGGFAGIVNSLGGIELDFPAPARDLKSGLDVPTAGTQTVDGSTALAYARSRSYQELRSGEWTSVNGGDIARTGRQRELLEKIIAKASSPAGMIRSPAVVAKVTGNLTVDSTVDAPALVKMAFRFRSAGDTQAVTLPVVGSTEGGISYVVRSEPAASELIDAFANGRALPAS